RGPQHRARWRVEGEEAAELAYPVLIRIALGHHPALTGAHHPGERRAAQIDDEVPASGGGTGVERQPMQPPAPLPQHQHLVEPGHDELRRLMAQGNFAILGERGILAVSGPDRRVFLQGLVSNDVEKLGANRAVYAALLTAQGKYLHDFIMVEVGEAIWLDAER